MYAFGCSWCTTFPPWKPLDDDGNEGDFVRVVALIRGTLLIFCGQEIDTDATPEAQMRATGDIARNHAYGV